MAEDEPKCEVTVTDDVKPENQSENLPPMRSPGLKPVEQCGNGDICVTLRNVCKSFNSAISEEQAWAVLYQLTRLYKDRIMEKSAENVGGRFKDVFVPTDIANINLHKDGTVHINLNNIGKF